MIQDGTRQNYALYRTAQDDTGRYRTARTPPFLKTVAPSGAVGSNPTPSANYFNLLRSSSC